MTVKVIGHYTITTQTNTKREKKPLIQSQIAYKQTNLFSEHSFDIKHSVTINHYIYVFFFKFDFKSERRKI